MGEKGLESPGSGLCASLFGCENETGASDQMPKPFSPNRSLLCPPSDKTSWGHSGPGGPGQRKLCAYPEPGGPSSRGLSLGGLWL